MEAAKKLPSKPTPMLCGTAKTGWAYTWRWDLHEEAGTTGDALRIRDDKAEWVTVETGQSAKDQIEVFGDLQSGDRILSAGTDAIRPGEVVQTQASQSQQGLSSSTN